MRMIRTLGIYLYLTNNNAGGPVDPCRSDTALRIKVLLRVHAALWVSGGYQLFFVEVEFEMFLE